MKKVITILLILAFCGGIGFLGYSIFFTKNIESVEYETVGYEQGGVQTLYLVDETTTPKFNDGRLKITYKDGTTKHISLAEAYNKGHVTVTDFSTSIEAQRSMKIVYKTRLINIDYTVIGSGMYYVSSYRKVVSSNEVAKTTYSLQTTTSMFELLNNGEFKYYVKKSGTQWYLYDGRNISSYKYQIVGNTLKIYLGEEEPAYNVTVDKDSRKFIISAEKSEYEGMKEIKELTYTDKKNNSVVDIDNSRLVDKTGSSLTGKVFNFYLNEKIADRKGDILIKIVYRTPIVTYSTETSTTPIIETLFVVADDSMIKSGNPLRTQDRMDYDREVSLWYEGYEFKLTYQVKVKS